MSNYQSVRSKVTDACTRVSRDPESVAIVAVSKKQPNNKVQELLDEGIADLILGESYVQEYAVKVEALNGSYSAHLIGPLQSNKIKKAVSLFDVIESVCSLKTANLIAKEAAKLSKVQKIFLQVNISGDPNKQGFDPEELMENFSDLTTRENVDICGLMTITRFYENNEDVRPDFIALRNLRNKLLEEFKLKELKLSMGMSADYEVAIEEGADLVRIGTAIFGERI